MDFIPSAAVLSAFAIASIALTITPGPDMTLFLGKTIAQSRTAGLVAFAGAATGLFVHTFAAAIGVSAVLAASPAAFSVLKVVGCAYLVWLAIDALRIGSSFAPGKSDRAPESITGVFARGLWINLLNPKIVVFFVTFLPQFVSAGDPSAARKLLFLGLFFIVLASPVCIGLILFADRIAEILRRSPRALRAVDWLFAGVMGAFAVKLLLTEGR